MKADNLKKAQIILGQAELYSKFLSDQEDRIKRGTQTRRFKLNPIKQAVETKCPCCGKALY